MLATIRVLANNAIFPRTSTFRVSHFFISELEASMACVNYTMNVVHLATDSQPLGKNVTVFFIANGTILRTWTDEVLSTVFKQLYAAAAPSKSFKYLIIDYDAAVKQVGPARLDVETLKLIK